MTTELTIVFDGTSEALQHHRLSIAELGAALQQLLMAVRRTASRIMVEATDDESYGGRGGRLSDLARGVDLQIASIGDGCVRLEMECVRAKLPSGTEVSHGDLLERTMQSVLSDIVDESKGKPRNAPVRRFLKALPATVTKQKYTARSGGKVIAEVEVGEMDVANLPPPVDRISRIVGVVAAIGVEPGEEYVALKTDVRRQKYFATSEMVERALALRGAAVRATVIDGTRKLVLRLDPVDAKVGGTAEQRLSFISTAYNDALAELAK